jgi:hypothetical protein
LIKTRKGGVFTVGRLRDAFNVLVGVEKKVAKKEEKEGKLRLEGKGDSLRVKVVDLESTPFGFVTVGRELAFVSCRSWDGLDMYLVYVTDTVGRKQAFLEGRLEGSGWGVVGVLEIGGEKLCVMTIVGAGRKRND